MSSRNYPGVWEQWDSCVITSTEDLYLHQGDVYITARDTLVINGRNVDSVDTIPKFLPIGQTITWESYGFFWTGHDISSGWHICFSIDPIIPAPGTFQKEIEMLSSGMLYIFYFRRNFPSRLAHTSLKSVEVPP